MAPPRVLVVHNRYRVEGGEERSVELQLRALERAGVPCSVHERRSTEVGRGRAAVSLLRGGERDERLRAAAAEADVVHVHNMQPLVGPRGLETARAAGAGTVLHLHNLRLFCSIAVASRDGGPCFRCHGRFTLPGLVLNCRDSLPEAAAYTAALSLHQPRVFAAVDRLVAPSAYAVGQLAKLGAPAERLESLPHYIPAERVAERSAAGEGAYALAAARLSAEKGIDMAIEAAARTGVPLRIAGEGPVEADLRALAGRLSAPVEFLGRVPPAEVERLLRGAAMTLLPSRYHEFSPYAVLEAMAAGVPVVASATGGVPELIGPGRCLPMGDLGALAQRMRELWDSPDRRAEEGEELIARVRSEHSEERFTERLLSLYGRLRR